MIPSWLDLPRSAKPARGQWPSVGVEIAAAASLKPLHSCQLRRSGAQFGSAALQGHQRGCSKGACQDAGSWGCRRRRRLQGRRCRAGEGRRNCVYAGKCSARSDRLTMCGDSNQDGHLPFSACDQGYVSYHSLHVSCVSCLNLVIHITAVTFAITVKPHCLRHPLSQVDAIASMFTPL